MTDDDARKAIQERRDRFVAEAMKERGADIPGPLKSEPMVCLSMVRTSRHPPASERGERGGEDRWGWGLRLVILGLVILVGLGVYLVATSTRYGGGPRGEIEAPADSAA